MNNAFAPQPFESFEDDLDLDLGPPPSGDDAPDRQPIQFTPAQTTAPQAPQPPATFNPVGELVAGAAEAFSPPAQSVEVSVPRIAIHIFAERQDTLAAAERAGQDRRLARAASVRDTAGCRWWGR